MPTPVLYAEHIYRKAPYIPQSAIYTAKRYIRCFYGRDIKRVKGKAYPHRAACKLSSAKSRKTKILMLIKRKKL